MKNIWIKIKWLHFFHWFFKHQKKWKQLITLTDEEGHQLALKHTEIIQKRISMITSALGSQSSLNNHQFNFDNNSITILPFKIPRTKDKQCPIIYKYVKQVQQQLNYTNYSLQHLNQQTTIISQFLFSFVLGRKKWETSKSTFSSTFSSTLSSSSSSYSAKSLDQYFIIPRNAAKLKIQLSTPTETILKEIQLN